MINYDIRIVIEDYYERLKANSAWDGTNHKLHSMIPVVEMLIKNNQDLNYTDFDIFHIPTAHRLHLFDGYVEEYRDRAEIEKNTQQMSKWFR